MKPWAMRRAAVWMGLLLPFAMDCSAQEAASAAAYPAKPIALVVGYAQGGSVDLVARAVAPGLSRRLKQPVLVENVAGASGVIGAQRVALADPDGYTLLLGSPAEVGINHLTTRAVKYDPLKDTTPISLIGSQPMVLVASKRVPVTTVDEFLSYAKSHAGQATYASSGMGTPLHLAGETIKQKADLDIRHVPYRGAGPMPPDVLGGQVDFAVMVLSSALPHIRSGRIKALGLTQAARSTAAPDIPPLAAHPQLTGADVSVWFGLLGPAKMPPAIANQLRAALHDVLKNPLLRKHLDRSSPAALGL